LYFYRAPSPHAFENEIERLLQEIHLYDVARSERSMAAHVMAKKFGMLPNAKIPILQVLKCSGGTICTPQSIFL
jgi:hypothetical protein